MITDESDLFDILDQTEVGMALNRMDEHLSGRFQSLRLDQDQGGRTQGGAIMGQTGPRNWTTQKRGNG